MEMVKKRWTVRIWRVVLLLVACAGTSTLAAFLKAQTPDRGAALAQTKSRGAVLRGPAETAKAGSRDRRTHPPPTKRFVRRPPAPPAARLPSAPEAFARADSPNPRRQKRHE